MNQELLKYLEETPLDKLGDVMGCLAERFHQHRLTHNGRVPLEVFESSLGVGGAHPCVEIVVRLLCPPVSLHHASYVLKKRGKDEAGWGDQYHIVGATVTNIDTVETAFQRAVKEIYGQAYSPLTMRREFVGVGTYSVIERRATYWTNVFLISITNLNGLEGEWDIFSDPSDYRIISCQRPILKWVNQYIEDRRTCPRFMDLGNFGVVPS